MPKTPDEIKKGMECCAAHDCKGCGYNCGSSTCIDSLLKDISSLIKRLQAQNAEQAERIQQLEAERDAAVEELSEKTELAKTLKMKFDQLVKEWRELEKMLRRGVQKEAAT